MENEFHTSLSIATKARQKHHACGKEIEAVDKIHVHESLEVLMRLNIRACSFSFHGFSYAEEQNIATDT